MTKAELLQKLDNILMAAQGARNDIEGGLYRQAYRSFQVTGGNASLDREPSFSFGSIGHECSDVRKQLMLLALGDGELE